MTWGRWCVAPRARARAVGPGQCPDAARRRPRRPGTHIWHAPGGGVEPGEDDRTAAVREFLEETGRTIEVGPLVWDRDLEFSFNHVLYRQFEVFFVAHVGPEFEPDAAGHNEIELQYLLGPRLVHPRRGSRSRRPGRTSWRRPTSRNGSTSCWPTARRSIRSASSGRCCRSRAPSLRFERGELIRSHGARLLAGMDEVGRGSLAGPVSVGVVSSTSDPRSAPEGVADSKLLAPAARTRLLPRAPPLGARAGGGPRERRRDRRDRDHRALRLAGNRALAIT